MVHTRSVADAVALLLCLAYNFMDHKRPLPVSKGFSLPVEARLALQEDGDLQSYWPAVGNRGGTLFQV